MSKNKKNNNDTTEPTEIEETTTTEAAPATEAVAEAVAETQPAPAMPATAPSTETALAAPSDGAALVEGTPEYPAELDTQMAFDPQGPHAKAILLKRLPHLSMELKRFQPVSSEGFLDMINALPEPLKTNMLDAFDRMNPDTTGMHLAREAQMRFFEMKLNQGTGNDPQRPEITPVGGYYSRDERVHAACSAATAKALKLPEFLTVYAVGVVEGGILWPPKKAPGEEEDGARLPLCTTQDRKRGTAYGNCAACTYKPVFVKGAPKPELSCSNEVTLFVVPEDFSGIYVMKFQRTAMEAARALIKKFQTGGWGAMWGRKISFGSRKEVSETDPNVRWFEPTVTIGEERTPPDISKSLKIIARLIETVVIYPDLRRSYILADNPKQPESTAPSNTTDGSALAASLGINAGAKAPALPDLSAPKVNV